MAEPAYYISVCPECGEQAIWDDRFMASWFCVGHVDGVKQHEGFAPLPETEVVPRARVDALRAALERLLEADPPGPTQRIAGSEWHKARLHAKEVLAKGEQQ